MDQFVLLLSVAAGVAILLLLILKARIPAFIALLIASICTGLMAGLSGKEIIDTVQLGMGSTLGFVATVVGLGAIFGGILEKTGGARGIAAFLLQRAGPQKAPLAMTLAGFVIAIPVFFDVAFIILYPVIAALQRNTGKSILAFAIPLLAGLATTHAFIPPTPGPVAVAQIIGADLGLVITVGLIAGVPAACIAGLLFGRFISSRIYVEVPATTAEVSGDTMPNIGILLAIITLPIALILVNTFVASGLIQVESAWLLTVISLLGHPFGALILANILAWYLLGRRAGFASADLLKISAQSLQPAGIIILLTGAGGVFKQVLVQTGAGEMMAGAVSEWGVPVIVFAFLAAALVRILQGSATVAMITSAGLVAPLLTGGGLSGIQLAAVVIAIASGATVLSHVNDSGFWLVKEYLGLTESQTFRSWTVMTVLLGVVGFAGALGVFLAG
ncbi:MAG: gluconate:H+ symporter [Saprospiraceae bacterium]|nr:gluconate:H+ symporter [Saprospiraceae bacterium]